MKKKSYPSIVYLFLLVCLSAQSFSTDVDSDLNPGGPEGPVLMDLQADQRVIKRQLQDGRSERPLGGKLYTGKMGDLVEADRLSRRAFNRNPELLPADKLDPDLTLATKVHDILTKRENVSVDRYATPTEKDDILRVIISSVIRDPSKYASIPVKDANEEAKGITDSFDKHVYIVDMAKVFAYELLKKGDIESVFDVFQDFSGIKRSHFLYLFEQAKYRHRRGLKIEKNQLKESQVQEVQEIEEPQEFENFETVEELKRATSQSNSQIAYDALSQLFNRVVAGFEEVRVQAFKVLIELVNNSRYACRDKVLFYVYEIANNANNLLLADEKGYSKQIREMALNTLNAIAGNDYDVKQVDALWYLLHIAKDSIMFDTLLAKLTSLADRGSVDALFTLRKLAETKDGKKAWDALTSRAFRSDYELQPLALGYIIDISRNEGRKMRALNTLISIAKNNSNKNQRDAFDQLINLEQESESVTIRVGAFDALETIAFDETNLLQMDALIHFVINYGSTPASKESLQKLIDIAQKHGHPQQGKAIRNLGFFVSCSNLDSEIRENARNALDTIVDNADSPEDIIALAKASLNREPIAAASAAAASVCSEGAVAAAAASVNY